ncbi:MAG: periplasmic heavy metal sensor [Synechococcaceae cyanobacterium RM1_1_27]|nr:periplasmic heavy metal sensor [Synechococcaceae cyanobacterium SM2_3_2]NJO86201.1 periplasmic heavy metal sensor [Synechococcaceae cyanobacterium RM1_1_27]
MMDERGQSHLVRGQGRFVAGFSLALGLSAVLLSQATATDLVAQTDNQPDRSLRSRVRTRLEGANRDDNWLVQLDLSDAQLRRIQGIRNTHQPRLLEAKQDLREARLELGSLLTGDATAEAIREQHNAVRLLDEEVRDLRFESVLQIREVLNPAQRQELGTMLEQRLSQY